MPQRHPEEIRRSVEATREELTYSLNDLQAKINQATDWRTKLRQNRQAVLIGAAVAGFVIGGGVAAAVRLVRG